MSFYDRFRWHDTLPLEISAEQYNKLPWEQKQYYKLRIQQPTSFSTPSYPNETPSYPIPFPDPGPAVYDSPEPITTHADEPRQFEGFGGGDSGGSGAGGSYNSDPGVGDVGGCE
jgi:hypothetical protein